MNNILKKYIVKLKNPKVLIIAGITGILLIYLSSFLSANQQEKKVKLEENGISVNEYREQLQDEICGMVTEITGSKKVSVVITLESSVKYSYADVKEEVLSNKTEDKSEAIESEYKSGYVTVKTSDGGEKALIITENMPEIRGVAIVCEGGDNEIINEKIKNTVTAAFDITSKRVYVCGGSR